MIPDIWVFVDPYSETTGTRYFTTSNSTEATDWVLQQERQRKVREKARRDDLVTFIQTPRPTPPPRETYIARRELPWWFFDRDLQWQNPRVRRGFPARMAAEARRDCSGRAHRRPARTGPSSWKTFKRRMNRGTMHKERRS